VITDGHRQGAVQSRQPAGNQSQHFRSDIVFRQFDEISPQRVGNHLIETALVHKAAVDESLLDRLPIEARLLQNVFGLRRLKHPLFDEDLGDLLGVHGRKTPLLCRAFLRNADRTGV
jgi:hypothetical protein